MFYILRSVYILAQQNETISFVTTAAYLNSAQMCNKRVVLVQKRTGKNYYSLFWTTPPISELLRKHAIQKCLNKTERNGLKEVKQTIAQWYQQCVVPVRRKTVTKYFA